ncbi:MAG: hypothetical protein ACK5RE_07610 [Pseudanabaena sp.]|jgi:hypothetical protein
MSNDDDKQFVLAQQSKRFAVLKFIWQETRTQPKDSLSYATAKDIATKTGIVDDDLVEIIQYLEDEGLIEPYPYMGKIPLSRITHRGKTEIEDAIIKPTEDTEHFLSSVIVNIETMNQTTINAARDANGNVIDSQINAPITNNISNIQQTVETSEILQAIAELRQQIITSTLPPNLQEVADEAIDTLQEEIVSPKSKPAKIKAAWMNICTVIGKAKDPIVLINAAFSLQEHLSKLNIDLSDIHLPHL